MMQSEKYEDTQEAYNNWVSYLRSFGVGHRLGIDVSSEYKGWLKPSEYYDRMHGSGEWNYARIISLSFGQGELGLTPVQMANISSSIANMGYYYTPHVISKIDGEAEIPKEYRTKIETRVEERHFEPVIQGMKAVTRSGTAASVAIQGIDIAGKTGTVQNPHGKNHSAYIAFAPADDPSIAIAVVVEESGYGATWAAPISHLMIEKYLNTDTVETTSRPYLESKLLHSNLLPYKYRALRDTSLYGN